MLEEARDLINTHTTKSCVRYGALGAFHSTKISGNSRSKSNGTESFRKFVSKISVHLARLSFLLEIWKFRKFSVPFGISTQYESTPVPLVVKSYKMVASLSNRHCTGCKMICHSLSLFLIAYPPQKRAYGNACIFSTDNQSPR